MYVPDDTEPLTMHHMVVEVEIAFPSLVIEAARTVLEIHPHGQCPSIEDHYQELVGLSIARGFTHKVRELFGGPRGLHPHHGADPGDGAGGGAVLLVDASVEGSAQRHRRAVRRS